MMNQSTPLQFYKPSHYSIQQFKITSELSLPQNQEQLKSSYHNSYRIQTPNIRKKTNKLTPHLSSHSTGRRTLNIFTGNQSIIHQVPYQNNLLIAKGISITNFQPSRKKARFSEQSNQNFHKNDEIPNAYFRILKQPPSRSLYYQPQKQQPFSQVSLQLPSNISSQTTSEPRYQFTNFDASNNFLTYIVGAGNNGELISEIMATRTAWKPTLPINSIFNFKWQQSSIGLKFDRLISNSGVIQIVNHFPNHQDISDKANLIMNLKSYSESRKIFLFDLTPTTFVIDLFQDDAELQLSKFISFFLKNMPKSKRPMNLKKVAQDWRQNMKKLIHSNDLDKFEKQSSVYSKPKMHPTFQHGENYVWLLKPTDLNRGRGIQLFNSLETLEKLLHEFKNGAINEYGQKTDNDDEKEKEIEKVKKQKEIEKPKLLNGIKIKSQEFVIQKYIEKPLLIDERKFDIRVWVLISHTLNVYVFKEGYLRTSCEKFNLENLQDTFVHLTNNAVQKYSTNYGQFEQGNQKSFQQLDDYLQSQNRGEIFHHKLWPDMKQLITISIQSVKKNFLSKEYKYCFEIFGYDFIIDDMMTVWLIEVNTNPCIEQSSQILKSLIPRMLNDAFKLTIDQVWNFNSPYSQIFRKSKSELKFPVQGYRDEEIMWELLFQMNSLTNQSPLKKNK